MSLQFREGQSMSLQLREGQHAILRLEKGPGDVGTPVWSVGMHSPVDLEPSGDGWSCVVWPLRPATGACAMVSVYRPTWDKSADRWKQGVAVAVWAVRVLGPGENAVTTSAVVQDDPPPATRATAKVYRYFVTFFVDRKLLDGVSRELKTDVIERGAPIACLDEIQAVQADLAIRHTTTCSPPVVTLINWVEMPS